MFDNTSILTGFNGLPQNVTNSTPLDDSLHFCATGSNALNVTIEAPLGSSNNKSMSWSGIIQAPVQYLQLQIIILQIQLAH